MRAWKNLKIRTKLFLLTVFACVLLLAASGTGLLGIHQSKSALSQVYQQHLAAINLLNEVRNFQMQIRIELLKAREEQDVFEAVAHKDRIDGLIFKVAERLQTYTEHELQPEERKLYDEFFAARMAFGQNGVMPTIQLLMNEKYKEADALRKQTLEPAFDKASQGIDALIQYQVDAAKKTYDAVDALTRRVQLATIAAIAVGLALIMLAALFLTREIARGVGRLQHATQKLADGDLTVRVGIDHEDEIGDVSRAFDRMAQEFGGLIGQIRQSTDRVFETCNTMTAASGRIAHSSSEQTDQARVAAESAELLTETVRRVTKQSEQAAQAAMQAGELSSRGLGVVRQALDGITSVAQTVTQSVELIQALHRRSDEIGRIVQVIKEIAEQTNLLALNAAIEAARAGEQGRGFAVVADEVRKLAERTGSATAEIADMIGKVQTETRTVVDTMRRGGEQMAQGVAGAHETGTALSQINAGIQNVATIVQDIAAAMHDQAKATEEITVRIEQIAHMAKDNSATIADAAGIFQTMTGVADQLHSAVGRFKLSGDSGRQSA